MYLKRNCSKVLDRLSKGFPVIGVTGPRQSGKTTLVRHYFHDKPYVTLENPENLEFAHSDPKGFLAQFPQGAILDEIQRQPELLSYIQGIVDDSKQLAQFVLTGSQQFGLRAKISQSLAGRIGLIELLPFSISELNANNVKEITLNELTYKGFYPPVYDRDLTAADWFASYVQTYIERDVKQLIHVRDTINFQTFLRLCAGRAGQVMNLSSIGNDCGISHNTVKEWLSVLEASYLVFKLTPHFENFSKRLLKSPKYYFHDTGLLCWLLGINSPEQLVSHPLKGAIFENLVVAEVLKNTTEKGEQPRLYYWRDSRGLEVDLIIDKGHQQLMPVEIKAGQTINKSFFRNLETWQKLAGEKAIDPTVIYAGESSQKRSNMNILSWKNLNELFN